jgi:hypothetical protein
LPRFLDAALLRHAQVSALPNPESFNVEGLRIWIARPDRGNYSIGGSGSRAWGDLYQSPAPEESSGINALLRSIFGWQRVNLAKFDLIAIKPRQNLDAITR